MRRWYNMGMLTALALMLVVCPLWAGSGRLDLPKGSARAEESLRAWIGRQDSIREAIGKAAQTPKPIFAEDDLKDALADGAAPGGRQALLARLPGLRQPRAHGCPNLEECAAAPLALDLEAGEPVEPAVRELLRPWLWLAQARSGTLSISPVPAGDPGLLEFSIPKLGLEGVALNIAPGPAGGARLWLGRGPELADLYARQRSQPK